MTFWEREISLKIWLFPLKKKKKKKNGFNYLNSLFIPLYHIKSSLSSSLKNCFSYNIKYYLCGVNRVNPLKDKIQFLTTHKFLSDLILPIISYAHIFFGINDFISFCVDKNTIVKITMFFIMIVNLFIYTILWQSTDEKLKALQRFSGIYQV